MKGTSLRNSWLLICLFAFVAFVLTRSMYPLTFWIWFIFAICCTAIVLLTASIRKLWERTAWILVGLAMATFVAATVTAPTWTQPDSLPNTALSFGTWARGAALILLIIATVLVVGRRRRAAVNLSGTLDAAIVFVAASIPTAEYLIYPLWQSDSAD